jgi:hypothetical protein
MSGTGSAGIFRVSAEDVLLFRVGAPACALAAKLLLPWIRNIHPTTACGRLTLAPLVFRIAD